MFFHGKLKLPTSEFSGYPKESSSPQMVSLSTGPCAPQTLRIQSHSMLSVGFSRCLNKTKRLKAAGTVSESCSASKETSASKLTASHHQNQHPSRANQWTKKKNDMKWNSPSTPTPQRKKKTQTKVGMVFPCFSTTTAKLVRAKRPKLDFVNLKQDCTPLALEHAQLSWRRIDKV